jgi:hypothetical protein
MRTIGEDLQADVQINKLALDTECEVQATLYAVYGEQFADAKSKKDAEKDRLDLILAQRELKLRANPPEGMKVTESVIDALVKSDTEVLEQKEAYRVACSDVYHLETAMGAIDHKKSQLNNLVQLQISAYYSAKSAGDRSENSLSLRRQLTKESE